MSALFAFNNAEDLPLWIVPSGHYDSEQQLWVADDTSYATERIVDGGVTTGSASVTYPWDADGSVDWD